MYYEQDPYKCITTESTDSTTTTSGPAHHRLLLHRNLEEQRVRFGMEDAEDQARASLNKDEVKFHALGSLDTEKTQVYNNHLLDSGSVFH